MTLCKSPKAKKKKATTTTSELTIPQSPFLSTAVRSRRTTAKHLSMTSQELLQVAKEVKSRKVEREKTKAYRKATQSVISYGKENKGKESHVGPRKQMTLRSSAGVVGVPSIPPRSLTIPQSFHLKTAERAQRKHVKETTTTKE